MMGVVLWTTARTIQLPYLLTSLTNSAKKEGLETYVDPVTSTKTTALFLVALNANGIAVMSIYY